jgi:RNA recognition motif-containing protein
MLGHFLPPSLLQQSTPIRRLTSTSSDSEDSGVDSSYRQERKIFVGGVPSSVGPEELANFFQSYGLVEEAFIIYDRYSGRHRGFGFVTFADSSSVDKVLADEDLELDGRKVDCKIAIPREQLGGSSGLQRTRKLFIGGLSPLTSEEQLKDHFSQFGNVANAVIMIDRGTNRSRGFGFVTYDSEDAVDSVLSRTHTINGKVIECKKAIPKQQLDVREQQFPFYGPPPYYYGYGPAPGYGAYGYPPYPPPRYREDFYYGGGAYGRGRFTDYGSGGRGRGRGGGGRGSSSGSGYDVTVNSGPGRSKDQRLYSYR